MKHEATTAALSADTLVRLGREALAMACAKHAIERAMKGAPAHGFKMGDRVTFKQGPMIVTANLVTVKEGKAFLMWRKNAKACYATCPVGKLRHAA